MQKIRNNKKAVRNGVYSIESYGLGLTIEAANCSNNNSANHNIIMLNCKLKINFTLDTLLQLKQYI